MKMQDRVRVYYDNNGTVLNVEWFPEGRRETDEEKEALVLNEKFKDLNTKIMDASDFENLHEYTGQLYIDSGVIKKDTDKSLSLMPIHVIKHKHLKSLGIKVGELIAAKTPDAVAIVKAQSELEKCRKSKSQIFWYKQAKANLDVKVADGEADKPKVRAMLEAKIKELGG